MNRDVSGVDQALISSECGGPGVARVSDMLSTILDLKKMVSECRDAYLNLI